MAIISLILQLNALIQLNIFIVHKISPTIEFTYCLPKSPKLNICMFTKYLVYLVKKQIFNVYVLLFGKLKKI